LTTLAILVKAWQSYAQQWVVLSLWNYLDWISRLVVFVLTAMFIFGAIVFTRGLYFYRESFRESPVQLRVRIVDLKRRVRNLQSIASTAPYLGLVGACFGILTSFKGFGMQRDSAIALTITYLTASLLPTASALVVAFSAAGSSSYLSRITENLELKVDAPWPSMRQNSTSGSRVFATFPLRKKFSKPPAFALMAVPGLAIVLAAFVGFASFRRPVGLEVHLLQIGAIETNNASRIQPLFIGLSTTIPDENPDIYLNLKKTSWDNLDGSLWNNLKTHPQLAVYVEADHDVRWAYVAMLIDSVKAHSNDVILLTAAPEGSSGHAHRSASSKQ
jgi:hypothetical protein